MLHAAEGGSFSVGKKRLDIKPGLTPGPFVSAPPPPPDFVPAALPDVHTERISRSSPLRLSMLAPATDRMVVSRAALIGFCLTSFAAGIVMTLAVDRAHTRAGELQSPPVSDPIVLKTTPMESPSAAIPTAAPAPASASARAAAEALVVQLAPPAVKAPTVKAPGAKAPGAKVRPAARAAARASIERRDATRSTTLPTREAHHRAEPSAATQAAAARMHARSADGDPTEAGPAPTVTPPKPATEKWVDPFEQ